MFGTRNDNGNRRKQIIPIEQYNLKLMSMGFLLDDASPAILRGRCNALHSTFLRQVDWGSSIFWFSICRQAPATFN